jgi:hypothetical protein
VLIAFAALLGVLRFSQVNVVTGPHQFFSQIAALAAIPLWGIARNWPKTLLTEHHSAAALFVLFVGGLGLVVNIFAPWWATLTAAFGAVTLTWSWRWQRSIPYALGIAALLAAFVVSSLQWSWQTISAIQFLHYLMAMGLILTVNANTPHTK